MTAARMPAAPTRALTTLEMTSKNVGDLLNAKGVSWGWFQGGFRPTAASVNGSVAQCHDGRVPHQYPSVNPMVVVPNPVPPFLTGSDIHTPATSPSNFDYVSHHDPFQFYASTRNSHHLPPNSVAAIGQQDQANHQYDTRDFFTALSSGHLPAVSFVKAPSAYNGHPGNSDPTVEQYWLTQVINAIQQSGDRGQHRDHHRLRRLGRLVRPRHRTHRQPVANQRGCLLQPRLWKCCRRCAVPSRPVARLRSASAAAGDLAVGEPQLRRSHPDQPGASIWKFIEDELEPGPHRCDRVAAGRGLLRIRTSRSAAGPVQLQGATVEAGGAADLFGQLRQEQTRRLRIGSVADAVICSDRYKGARC